jgi:site-specific recombinase XerD
LSRLYGNADPALVSQEQVRDYFVHMRVELKAGRSSMSVARAALACFFCQYLKLGENWELWQELRVRAERKLPVVLTRPEVQRLLAAASHDRFRTILRLIYHTGLRIGEACRLSLGDLDAQGLRLHIRKTKTRQERFVPINMAMWEDLQRFMRRHGHPQWVFPALPRYWSRHGLSIQEATRRSEGPMSESAVQAAMRLIVVQSGIKKAVTVHTLRHCYATHLLEEGVSIHLISKFLGHSNLETTMLYTHLTEVSVAKTRAVLDRLYGQCLCSGAAAGSTSG